jgi:diadenosine tetraphosphate (Ap4A) HIT family hydrolase
VFFEDELVRALWDDYPLSPGHALVVPRRHVASFFETTLDERAALLNALDRAKHVIELEHCPDGYNLGVNDGQAAGQTVFHLHAHLIPRYRGDREDPRGGVRWILPDKAAYWSDR